MITMQVADLKNDLDDLAKEVESRLSQMVRGFMLEFTTTAVNFTPLGDENYVAPNGKKYMDYYKQREAELGLSPIAGYSQGNWQVTDGPVAAQSVYSGEEAISKVSVALRGYKLGQTLVLGNATPYLNWIHRGANAYLNIEGEIMKPTLDSIMASSKINLLNHYKAN